MKKEIIEKLVARFGKDRVIEAFEHLGIIKKDDVSTQGDTPGTCDPGYYWSDTLKRCVLDIG